MPIFSILTRSLGWVIHSWTAYKTIYNQNKIKNIDIIETVDGGNYWLSLTKKIPIIEHAHCSNYTIKKQCDLPIDLGTKLERKFQLMTLRNANAVISPSNAMLHIVEKENGNKLLNTIQIPLCIKGDISHQINQKSPTKFIFASRNDTLKGGNTLLKAIQLANNEIEEKSKFYFIGYEPRDESQYPPNIVFKKFLPRNELLEFYPECDVALLPSLFDNSPLFIYESMAAGLPVIATNVGGIPELIHHGKNGYLIEKGDDVALSNRIIEMVLNPNKRDHMGKNARKFIMDYANVEKIANKKIKLYQKIIAQ